MSLLHADKDAHNGGYLIGAGVFMAIFVAAVIVQIATKSFRPAVCWLTIVATTTVGTAMADFADRSGRARVRPFHGDRHPRRGDGRPDPPRTATAGRSPSLGLGGAGGVEANAGDALGSKARPFVTAR